MSAQASLSIMEAAQKVLERGCREASEALKAIPGVGSGPMGLTPDHVKQTVEYKQAKRDYDIEFSALREINARIVKAKSQLRKCQK